MEKEGIHSKEKGQAEQEALSIIYKNADRFMLRYLLANFSFGIFLAFFYDTWIVAFVVGSLSLLAYFLPKYLLKNSTLYQFVGSAVTAIFAAQFIYQMHGLFEMHFWVFIASLALISYQRWTLQLPLIIIVVLHHGIFAWLQYTGVQNIYFTQLDYMSLSTFLFHGALATMAVLLSGYWSYYFRRETMLSYQNTLNLQKQVENIDNNIAFADNIRKGNLDADYQINDDDKIGMSLLHMRDGLLQAFQKEQQDKFINKGIAQISDILRNNMTEVEILCDKLLLNIVKYLDATQGAIFIVEGEEKEDVKLLLKACYAFDRKKYINKEILPGQGLVGQVYLEKSTTYLTKVPNDYVQITSGLGEARPGSIVLIPIKSNEDVVGVLELASFKPIEQFKISFLEKIGESIASTIISVKVNERTQELLAQTRGQTEEMRAQEEEMRQNMEELSATQEEMHRKEKEMQKVLDASLESEKVLKEELLMLRNQVEMK